MYLNKIIRLTLLLLFLTAGSTQFLVAQTTNIPITMATTPACSLDGSATATPTGGTPPYNYDWYGPLGFVSTGNVNTLTGVVGGYYQVHVTDASIGSGWASFTIGSPFTAMITSVTQDVCSTGVGSATASASGTGPFTYNWSNGQSGPTATGLTAGTYEITITDANGCYISSPMDSLLYAHIYNSSPLVLTMGQTNSQCTDGTASVVSVANGTAPYTYVWSTIPPQFGATATGLAPSSYAVTVTDAAGCDQVGYASINQLPNSLTGTITSTAETCIQANGTASVSISGGTAPYTYLWSNGATTPTTTGLSYGNYSVTVTDNNGCPKVKSVVVQRHDPLILTMTGVNPSCANTGGSVSVSVSGGATPYTYQWWNGSTASSVSGLAEGSYGVIVTDANGCQDYQSIHIFRPANCFAQVTGTLTADMNANCIYDGSDFNFGGRFITSGNHWAATAASGFYSLMVDAGNITVAESGVQSYFQYNCPATGDYALTGVVPGNTYSGLDFFDSPISLTNELYVWAYASPARTTQAQTVYIHYANQGSTTLNAVVNFTHDPLMTLYNGYSMSNYTLATRTLTYNLGTINPGMEGDLFCSFTIPSLTPSGTSYSHGVEILPIVGDALPSNNSDVIAGVVVGSFDPNRKSVMPDGLLTPGTDSLLTYTVEFQNTGSDTAFTVAIRDSLDPAIDPLSVEVLGSSHFMTWTLDYPGYLTFTFDDIRLPDSIINEPASHGWLRYRAKLKPNLSLGTTIHNKAAIYFDYNAPIVTNTTLNTFGLVSVEAVAGNDATFAIYPNPAASQVMVLVTDRWEGETDIRVVDLHGRVVHASYLNPENGRSAMLELQHLPKGVYFVECQTEFHKSVKKLILQ